MKTEMNPDLEFLRGLRDRLNIQCLMLNIDKETCNAYEWLQKSGQHDACHKLATEITDYLKTRGIE